MTSLLYKRLTWTNSGDAGTLRVKQMMLDARGPVSKVPERQEQYCLSVQPWILRAAVDLGDLKSEVKRGRSKSQRR
ncbi:ADP-ribosylation factor GTPase-activating protein glo3 [Fusarium oxysporum f. sp. albedinis]|nr:ADP-ribosylation factor GTPase-activating protein glo3 [Fusarium oxysporum f. sp. albedinis]